MSAAQRKRKKSRTSIDELDRSVANQRRRIGSTKMQRAGARSESKRWCDPGDDEGKVDSRDEPARESKLEAK
jgi:hypothetical protein